jgi:hypothetical protein
LVLIRFIWDLMFATNEPFQVQAHEGQPHMPVIDLRVAHR